LIALSTGWCEQLIGQSSHVKGHAQKPTSPMHWYWWIETEGRLGSFDMHASSGGNNTTM